MTAAKGLPWVSHKTDKNVCAVKILNTFFSTFPYSSSYNLTPPISRVLIGPHLIFCPLTSPTWCNLPGKCTPVKYKARQKLRFQLSHRQPPGPNPDVTFSFKSYVKCCDQSEEQMSSVVFLKKLRRKYFCKPEAYFQPSNICGRAFLA